MPNTTINLDHLAKLTNVTVDAKQAEKLVQQFSDTLAVVAKLNELDTTDVQGTPQVTGLSNRTREDTLDPKRTLTQTQALANAARTHKGYFMVPAVLEAKP
jgi:aspartyl/glutamyl-tRNA(Asn/Gln) amidotransferase C subunit